MIIPASTVSVHGFDWLSVRLMVCEIPSFPDGALYVSFVIIAPLTVSASVGVFVLIPTPLDAWTRN